MNSATLILSAAAGALSTLSPCVLPLLPIVIGAAVSEHRYAPVALALGVALSFVSIGIFVATVGYSIGLSGGIFRNVSAAVLLIIGVVMVLPRASIAFAGMASGIAAHVDGRLGGFDTSGVGGQFMLGLLLGAIWSPCAGPTLGAASALAARGRDLGDVALVMGVFGIGAAAPLLVLGLLSRETMLRMRSKLIRVGDYGKVALGALLIVTALLILSGTDKLIEARLVAAMPAWLTELTTRY